MGSLNPSCLSVFGGEQNNLVEIWVNKILCVIQCVRYNIYIYTSLSYRHDGNIIYKLLLDHILGVS